MWKEDYKSNNFGDLFFGVKNSIKCDFVLVKKSSKLLMNGKLN
jgi:hypothetical protein